MNMNKMNFHTNENWNRIEKICIQKYQTGNQLLDLMNDI